MSSNFFDAMYADADGDATSVPWQDAVSRPMITEWIAAAPSGNGRRALVVAAGLGDDAAALAARGYDVTAFDYAPTAVEWARQRHSDAAVDWQVADLFDPPDEWAGAFDLVAEVFTVQAVAREDQTAAAEAVRGFLAPGGVLVAVAIVFDGTSEAPGPPWPLPPSVVATLTDGLIERGRRTDGMDGFDCIRWELEQPDP